MKFSQIREMRKYQKVLEKPTHQKIQSLAQEIGRKFHPNKIILFGSYAYGIPTQDSDVDLLVIMNTKRRSVEQAVVVRQSVDFPFPVDLIVRTPEQIDERLHLGDFFIKEILTRGKVLYETYYS